MHEFKRRLKREKLCRAAIESKRIEMKLREQDSICQRNHHTNGILNKKISKYLELCASHREIHNLTTDSIPRMFAYKVLIRRSTAKRLNDDDNCAKCHPQIYFFCAFVFSFTVHIRSFECSRTLSMCRTNQTKSVEKRLKVKRVTRCYSESLPIFN